MKRSVWIGVVAALTIAVSSTAAQAAPFTLDFSDSSVWGGADGEIVFTTDVPGFTVNLGSVNGLLSQTGAGLGVKPLGGDDEISCIGFTCEFVVSGFEPSQFVHEIEISRLFDAPGHWGEDESGYYRINGGDWTKFNADSATGNLTLAIGQGDVSSIAFASFDGWGISDFAVKSITVEGPLNISEVPEPASMVLLGSGLLGAFAQRRRKKNQTTV